MKKCVFPIQSSVISCPTCTKNLERFFVPMGSGTSVGDFKGAEVMYCRFLLTISFIESTLAEFVMADKTKFLENYLFCKLLN